MSFKETIKGWAPKELDFQKVIGYESMRDGSARSMGTRSSYSELTNKINDKIRHLNDEVKSEFLSSEINNKYIEESEILLSKYNELIKKLSKNYNKIKKSKDLEYNKLLRWECLTNGTLTDMVSRIMSTGRYYSFEEINDGFKEIFNYNLDSPIRKDDFNKVLFKPLKNSGVKSIPLCYIHKNGETIGLHLIEPIYMGDTRDRTIITIEDANESEITFNRKLQEISYVTGKVFNSSNKSFKLSLNFIETILDNDYIPGESNLYVPFSHGGPSPYELEESIYQAETAMQNNIHNLPDGITLEKFLED